jgi:hypothetical protein
MNGSSVNWLAILAAGLSAFVLGGVWYSPSLLGRAWMKENNFSLEQIRQANKPKVFGWAFVLSLVMSVNLGMFLGGRDITLGLGLLYGCLTGVWIFCGIAIVALFEQRSAKYIFINGGYMLVALTLMGGIIGAWK